MNPAKYLHFKILTQVGADITDISPNSSDFRKIKFAVASCEGRSDFLLICQCGINEDIMPKDTITFPIILSQGIISDFISKRVSLTDVFINEVSDHYLDKEKFNLVFGKGSDIPRKLFLDKNLLKRAINEEYENITRQEMVAYLENSE